MTTKYNRQIGNRPLIFALALLFFAACQPSETGKILPDLDPPPGSSVLPATTQRTTGNAAEGWDFLNYGNFIGGGIPYDIFVALQSDPANLLGRSGDNALIPPSFNAYDFDNGVRVVGGLTCFGCHASMLNGAFVPGLGNSLSDFSSDNSGLFDLLEFAVINTYGTDSPEWEAFEPYNRGVKAVAGNIVLPFRGINPAFTLEELAAAHRNPADLSWSEDPVFNVNANMVGSDVPPLWHIQKKNALYYTGLGRGDFAKMLQQVSIVALTDSTQAAQINTQMDDVVAWIMELEPPAYPEAIDPIQAALGAEVFRFNCQRCHGSYGEDESYPNLLISMDQIGTDPVYAEELLARTDFQNWYDNSWFANAPYPTETFSSLGYVAPPLDGIWATAPYLHNGSVPTLYDLLNSDSRPSYWKRSFDSEDLDFVKVGWTYSAESAAMDVQTYNTTARGYGNQGHYFGDALSEEARMALIEYLKTL